MSIIKMSQYVLSMSAALCSGQIFAEEHMHNMSMQIPTNTSTTDLKPPSEIEHAPDHGKQIYQYSELSTKWLKDDSGTGVWLTEFETLLGSDENRVFFKLDTEKTESEHTNYDTKLMYSRGIEAFWDVQAGVRYTYDTEKIEEKNQTYAAIGLNGLAPYFFDTDVYLYVGKNQQYIFSIETDRDVLLTQKLILKPYLDAEIVLNDDSKYARRSGLNLLHFGVETRYEINKNVMPFIDISYGYEKGMKETSWQDASDAEKKWLYGIGIQFVF